MEELNEWERNVGDRREADKVKGTKKEGNGSIESKLIFVEFQRDFYTSV
jgi:hypothetical protein